MKNKLLLIVAFVFVTVGNAQKLKVKSGDFKFLKDQKKVNVVFDYGDMKLFKDNRSNEEYVKEHSAKLESESKGKGKTWEKKWIASRELIYQPKFLELMNRYLLEKKGIEFNEGLEDTKYTLVVKTTWVYPGWNAGVMRQPAKVSTLLTFVESGTDNAVLELTAQNAPGNRFGGTFSNEDRIGEGYAKTGKTLAGLLLKKLK